MPAITKSCLLLIAVCFLVGGCGPSGPKTYPVTGTVTYRGKPLSGGTVLFVPEQGAAGRNQTGLIDTDGRYKLEATAGTHEVAVVALVQEEGKASGQIEGGTQQAQPAKSPWLIPEKYARYDTSGIVVVVEPSESNNKDINLQ